MGGGGRDWGQIRGRALTATLVAGANGGQYYGTPVLMTKNSKKTGGGCGTSSAGDKDGPPPA